MNTTRVMGAGVITIAASAFVGLSWLMAGIAERGHAEEHALTICVATEDPAAVNEAVAAVSAASESLPAAHARLRSALGTDAAQWADFSDPKVVPCDHAFEPLDVDRLLAHAAVRQEYAAVPPETRIRVFVSSGKNGGLPAGARGIRMPYQFQCADGGHVCFEASTAVYFSADMLKDTTKLVAALTNAAGLDLDARMGPGQEPAATGGP